MTEHPSIAETAARIATLHAGQFDWTGLPYHTHPNIVMGKLPASASDAERHAALLHDTVEDCEVTLDELIEWGYSPEVVEMVRLVSRVGVFGEMTYIEWVRYIAASGNIGAMRVKLADNLHNSDPARIAAVQDPEKQAQLREMAAGRYRRSMAILTKALIVAGAELPA